jgi:type IV secretion system protein VirB2
MKYPIRALPLNALAVAAVAALFASPSHAAQPGAPQGASPLLSAVTWMQDSLMGNVATVVAIMAVGVVGFMMLTGRLNWRYGATVILGCFILFGAATIVGGIQAAAGGV